MKGKDIVKKLIANGWSIARIHGSHIVMVKGSDTEVIPVHGNKDLPKGLWESIKKRRNL
ncbi:MAG: type II toxin-antitoxin system HicA family toxin [Firmicutes bacterium]|nr:type II toxin-antitoxin system HicA family toxin [Bacillota bacterium]